MTTIAINLSIYAKQQNDKMTSKNAQSLLFPLQHMWLNTNTIKDLSYIVNIDMSTGCWVSLYQCAERRTRRVITIPAKSWFHQPKKPLDGEHLKTLFAFLALSLSRSINIYCNLQESHLYSSRKCNQLNILTISECRGRYESIYTVLIHNEAIHNGKKRFQH